MENVIATAASQLASGEAAGGGDENKAAMAITNTTLASAAAAAAGTNTPSTIKREQPTAPVQAQQQQNIVTNSNIVGTAAGMSGLSLFWSKKWSKRLESLFNHEKQSRDCAINARLIFNLKNLNTELKVFPKTKL